MFAGIVIGHGIEATRSFIRPTPRVCSGELRPILSQLRSAFGKHVHLCSANDEPEVLEETADLVLKIPFDLDEESTPEK